MPTPREVRVAEALQHADARLTEWVELYKDLLNNGTKDEATMALTMRLLDGKFESTRAALAAAGIARIAAMEISSTENQS
jgi:hypothetical protein